MLALVAGNAFFVIGEYSVVTARRAALAARADAGSAGARAALRLMDHPVRVISTVQVGITAIGILIGAVGQPLVATCSVTAARVARLRDRVRRRHVPEVVLGELVPEGAHARSGGALAALVARPITDPRSSARLCGCSSSRRGAAAAVRHSARWWRARASAPEELRALIDEAEGSGVIPRAQEELLHNVFDFARREAGDVMVPAPDVAWLDAGLLPGPRSTGRRAAARAATRSAAGRSTTSPA